eukprot:gnl/TRDRNA2_/TRDRNA2_129364_c0_seq1.p1 gnl/TRDRNA2_/TRDRNA2_129364_c0~~gnl/TRDRNA2_/TRDRNA2_129364_c0_seq1.p1  ORF type:complete len:289 (+),score=40.71 gnl/TRDRNA2_/TRDRNA2_129364_c0_seq1:2-868(+)
MRIRASVIGFNPLSLRFGIGHNLDMAVMNTPVCDAMVNATKFLGSSVMWDLHVDGDTPEQEDHWSAAFLMATQMLDRLGSQMKLAVFEENAFSHGIVRGLNRARFANTYARLADRFSLATAANGMQVFGFNDNGWDQGAIFIGPDRVWLSPFGYVDYLVARASEPVVLQTRVDSPSGSHQALVDILAMRSNNASSIVLRVANFDPKTMINSSVELPPETVCARALVSTLQVPSGLSPATVNPPSNMTLVAPVEEVVVARKQWMFPALSLTTIRWQDCTSSTAEGLVFV